MPCSARAFTFPTDGSLTGMQEIGDVLLESVSRPVIVGLLGNSAAAVFQSLAAPALSAVFQSLARTFVDGGALKQDLTTRSGCSPP